MVLGRSRLGVLSRPTRALVLRRSLLGGLSRRPVSSGVNLSAYLPRGSGLRVEARGKVEEACLNFPIGRDAPGPVVIPKGVQGPLNEGGARRALQYLPEVNRPDVGLQGGDVTGLLATQNDLTDLRFEGIQFGPESPFPGVEDVVGEMSQLPGIGSGLFQIQRRGVSEETREQPPVTVGGAEDASMLIEVDQG